MHYIKHIYWLTKEKEKDLRLDLMKRNIELETGKDIVCPGLSEFDDMVVVSPETWSGICHRQGSWYRKSEKKSQYLIISAFELQGFEQYKEAVITRSDFRLPGPATREDKEDMVGDTAFRSLVPKEWDTVSDTEKKIWMRWAKRSGSELDWDEIFLTHTANHANFIKPRFFIERDGETIPYSIDRSAHLCSCCLELFQVIGNKWRKKLVAPCAGAVIFARLPKDRYFLVERP